MRVRWEDKADVLNLQTKRQSQDIVLSSEHLPEDGADGAAEGYGVKKKSAHGITTQ